MNTYDYSCLFLNTCETLLLNYKQPYITIYEYYIESITIHKKS